MKKILLSITIAFVSLIGWQSFAQTEGNGSPKFPKMDVSPMDMAHAVNENDEPLARIIYGRPQKRNRQVFGKVVRYGELWRTGANEATELTLYKDMQIEGKNVEAGTYTLYTIPDKGEWTIILNNKTNTWGAYDYQQEDDIVRTKVPVKKLQSPLDALSMTFDSLEDGTLLRIGWDDQYVEVPFTFPEAE